MHSNIALKLYGMIKSGIIKSNAMFWREFFNQDKIESINLITTSQTLILT